jgi:hypothetical protein
VSGRSGVLTLALVLVFADGSLEASPRPQGTASEIELKAAFLHNFARFTEWPESAFEGAGGEFRLGVLGPDGAADIFERILKDKKVGARPLKIHRGENPDDLKSCVIVFVADAEKAQIPALIAKVGRKPVLTVGESEGFAQSGGILNFYLDANKVRFEINPDAAGRAGLKVTKLIGVAPRVIREK